MPPFLPLSDSLADRAQRWMHTPGGRHVMRDLFAISAGYVWAWKRSGIPLSVALVFELERQRIKTVSARAQRRGFKLGDEYGYTLNNSYRAYISRHIMDRRKEWAGLFELRELKAERAAAKGCPACFATGIGTDGKRCPECLGRRKKGALT